jgi:hypothetical protein
MLAAINFTSYRIFFTSYNLFLHVKAHAYAQFYLQANDHVSQPTEMYNEWSSDFEVEN